MYIYIIKYTITYHLSHIIIYHIIIANITIWLVVSTPLKNISQMGLLFPYILEKWNSCSVPPTNIITNITIV